MTTRPEIHYRSWIGITVALLTLAGALLLIAHRGPEDDALNHFQGQRAYQDIAKQLAFGPRFPGSDGHAQVIDYIHNQIRQAGWETHLQAVDQEGDTITNIVATRGDADPEIILAAHYDTRKFADQMAGTDGLLPVPGANDGASGVAVLLELARTIPEDASDNVWLVFFDAEDGGGIDGAEWIRGSTAFAASLQHSPRAVIVVDMIGDADLNIFMEQNSDPTLTRAIWDQAARLGYHQFIPEEKYSMLDDHTPFVRAGIPSVLIIDFDYPYWHTTGDTLEKTSADSLEAVGQTLLAWILAMQGAPQP